MDGFRRRVASALFCGGVIVICLLIGWHVWVKLAFFRGNFVIASYTIVVTLYVLSRFVLAALYRPPRDTGYEPSVAIVIPAYNEGESVAATIRSCLSLDYPRDKLEVVVINDGSTDDTLEHMLTTANDYDKGAVRCFDLGNNQGKRAAMAVGIRKTSAEILVFIDSDSIPEPDAIRRLVQGFTKPDVGAISGITHVRNASVNTLTRMQATRYDISFDLLKRAESVLGAVTCCSGCFAAYRRAAVVDLLEDWEHQRFLGVECTYGDDRALTNRVIRAGWLTLYDARAVAKTQAPTKYLGFLRQQARWKKSWAREGPLLLTHVWYSRTRAFPSIVAQTVAGVLSPFIVLYTIFNSVLCGQIAFVYVIGLCLVSSAYSLVYRMISREGLWPYAFFGAFFYVLLSPQLIWSVLRIRDGRWGTRALALSPPNAVASREGSPEECPEEIRIV